MHTAMITRACASLAVVLAVSSAVGEQPLDLMPVESRGDIRVLADRCSFRGDSEAGLVEVYVQTFLSGLTFIEGNDGGVEASVECEASLAGPGGMLMLRRWDVPVRLSTLDEALQPGLSLYDRLDLAVKPGAYDLNLVVRDAYGTHSATIVLPLISPDFSSPGLKLSDVQLARSIAKADDSGDRWTKNGYRVVPNPSRRYGAAQPVLWCYTEAYGLRAVGEAGEFWSVMYEIEDAEGRSVLTEGPFLIRRAGSSGVLVGTLDVRDLAPGYYRLVVAVEDTITHTRPRGARTSTLFVRANDAPGPVIAGLTAAESTAAEIELRFAATTAEARRFRELNPVGRALFMERFWAARDPDTSTTANEAREELHRRIAIAQGRFKEMGRQGMDTDRGRVFIRYGPPTEITRASGGLTCKDHEVWIYEHERHYEFVFFDENGSGSFRLIHSNYPGEVSRPQWQSIVCETAKVQTF